MVGANAYLGAEAILRALDHEPHVVITGRVADPSLFVAPLAHRFGWKADDWHHLGAATAIGHLLECSTQVTGGYFADPPYKTVPDIAFLGCPLAEVEGDATGIVTKLDGTGGLVSEHTVKEQLMYEVHDPRAYLTPDVTADFSQARVSQEAKDRVRISGATGRTRPEKLKAIIGFDGGWLAEAEFSYAGPGAGSRAELAVSILQERLQRIHHCQEKVRFDLIGMNALHSTAVKHPSNPLDVRLRAALRTHDRALAQTLLEEVESLWLSGPAGGGGYRGKLTPSVTTQAIYVERSAIELAVEVMQS